ncbi:hypothetical protein PVL29_002415 [Vitis rotundifolia]|uniref:Uncharacterized protein n=1 Tax=Vitis rotundifolia TaxID=103349 RepID=A0AA39AI06_VITRO|nr:hypothetical protein PVL29_002415 [Vitis rotundifolia]
MKEAPTLPSLGVSHLRMPRWNLPLRRTITADSTLMNPNTRILALKAQLPGTTADLNPFLDQFGSGSTRLETSVAAFDVYFLIFQGDVFINRLYYVDVGGMEGSTTCAPNNQACCHTERRSWDHARACIAKETPFSCKLRSEKWRTVATGSARSPNASPRVDDRRDWLWIRNSNQCLSRTRYAPQNSSSVRIFCLKLENFQTRKDATYKEIS